MKGCRFKKYIGIVLVWFGLVIFGAMEIVGLPNRPGNGKIAFTSDRDGNPEIYVMNSDGTDQERLTNNPGIDFAPAFSPDGRRLAFLKETTRANFALVVMNLDGTSPRVITPIVFFPYPYCLSCMPWSISWSPDGTRIAFQEGDAIFTVNIDGTDRRNLTNYEAVDIEPAWSPDGSQILFSSSRIQQYYRSLYIMKSDGSNVRPFLGEYGWESSPDWSPFGNRVVFSKGVDDYSTALFITDGTRTEIFDGGGKDRLTRSKPRWSPDGKKIVYQIFSYLSDNSDIFVKKVQGDGSVQLTHDTGNNYFPSWQPIAVH